MRDKLIYLLAFCCYSGLKAQNEVCFAYDASGNRIQRASCCASCQAIPEPGAAQARQSTSKEAWIALAPNPAVQTIQIQWLGFSSAALWSITDEQGKLLKQGTFNTNLLDVSDLPAGKYFLSVKEYPHHHITSFIKIQ